MPSPSLTLSDSRPLRYVSFFYLYVMQGVPSGSALTAVANYLVADGASAAAVGSFVAIVGLPWALQFVGPRDEGRKYCPDTTGGFLRPAGKVLVKVPPARPLLPSSERPPGGRRRPGNFCRAGGVASVP